MDGRGKALLSEVEKIRKYLERSLIFFHCGEEGLVIYSISTLYLERDL